MSHMTLRHWHLHTNPAPKLTRLNYIYVTSNLNDNVQFPVVWPLHKTQVWMTSLFKGTSSCIKWLFLFCFFPPPTILLGGNAKCAFKVRAGKHIRLTLLLQTCITPTAQKWSDKVQWEEQKVRVWTREAAQWFRVVRTSPSNEKRASSPFTQPVRNSCSSCQSLQLSLRCPTASLSGETAGFSRRIKTWSLHLCFRSPLTHERKRQ